MGGGSSDIDSRDFVDSRDSRESQDSHDSRESQNLSLTLASLKNLHFYDIFGDFHRFFRPYFHTSQECKVRILPRAIAHAGDKELVWTKSKKALTSHTSQRVHSFALPKEFSTLNPRSKFKVLTLTLLRHIKFVIMPKRRIKGSVALINRINQDCYGHFVREIIGGFYQLKLARIEADYYIFPTKHRFQREMAELLGIKNRIIPSQNALICADKLIIPTLMHDYEIIEYRAWRGFRSLCHPLFVGEMYDDLLPQIAPKRESPRKIFLTRPNDSNRNIENLAEVEGIFREFGYEVILPDSLSLSAQIALMRGVEVLASMHGSGLNSALFARRNIVIFEIFSQYYHDTNPQLSALIRGMKYFYMVGKTHKTSMHPQKESVYLNPQKLKNALKRLENVVLG